MRSFSPRREEPALAAALRSRLNWKKPASRWYKLPPRSRSPKWWVPTASSWARASCTSPAMLNCRPRRKKSCGENWCRKRWTRCNRMRSSNFCVGGDALFLPVERIDYRNCHASFGSGVITAGLSRSESHRIGLSTMYCRMRFKDSSLRITCS